MLTLGAVGCDRKPEGRPDRATSLPVEAGAPETELTASSERNLPDYRLPPDLARDYPQVAGFVQQFLNVCLAGDYEGYRQLVSRIRTPESQGRFEAMLGAIASVDVVSIREVSPPDLPPPVFVVVSHVTFKPDQRVSARGQERDIAILVFREQDAWRMLPAPPALQPHDEAPPPASQPDEPNLPPYPWDEGIDY